MPAHASALPHMPAPALAAAQASGWQCAAITDPQALAALAPEWNALWARADAPRLSQGAEWALAGWRICAAPRGARLWVLTLREEGRLVLVWPLEVRREKGIRIARPLGSDGTEYDGLLHAASPRAGAWLAAAWAYAAAHLPADGVVVPFVGEGSARAASLVGKGLWQRRETLPAPFVRLRDGAGWQAYWQSRSKNLRNGSNRRRRRLEELGPVAFRLLEEPAEIRAAIALMLRAKAAWMAARGLANPCITRPDFRSFLEEAALHPAACGSTRLMVLDLCGQPAAIKLGTLDGTRFESFISTFDPALDAYSPGTLLQVESLRWCADHGLDYDMRIGAEGYKADWATGDAPVTSHTIALTLRGVGWLWAQAADYQFRLRRDGLRDKLKAALAHRREAAAEAPALAPGPWPVRGPTRGPAQG
ncbi:MAG TPA: GNAT family N-acetyltransferase [Novosphingobium sp.]|nr:GNAT family N-acetyltransferase [Novosphingobium sp.]HZV10690.1 GNAT family N-acetyltransferase [Novosphingobium sp.]